MEKVYLNFRAVRHCLNKTGMPLKELAKAIGISASYLSQLVNLRRSPSGAVRKKLMEVLKCKSFNKLFFLKETPTKQDVVK